MAINALHSNLPRQLACTRTHSLRWLINLRRIGACAAVLKLKIVQVPTLGAVLQCIHRVRNAQVEQGLRPDDAAGTPRTMDDHRRIGAGYHIGNTVGELPVRATDGTRY